MSQFKRRRPSSKSAPLKEAPKTSMLEESPSPKSAAEEASAAASSGAVGMDVEQLSTTASQAVPGIVPASGPGPAMAAAASAGGSVPLTAPGPVFRWNDANTNFLIDAMRKYRDSTGEALSMGQSDTALQKGWPEVLKIFLSILEHSSKSPIDTSGVTAKSINMRIKTIKQDRIAPAVQKGVEALKNEGIAFAIKKHVKKMDEDSDYSRQSTWNPSSQQAKDPKQLQYFIDQLSPMVATSPSGHSIVYASFSDLKKTVTMMNEHVYKNLIIYMEEYLENKFNDDATKLAFKWGVLLDEFGTAKEKRRLTAKEEQEKARDAQRMKGAGERHATSLTGKDEEDEGEGQQKKPKTKAEKKKSSEDFEEKMQLFLETLIQSQLPPQTSSPSAAPASSSGTTVCNLYLEELWESYGVDKKDLTAKCPGCEQKAIMHKRSSR